MNNLVKEIANKLGHRFTVVGGVAHDRWSLVGSVREFGWERIRTCCLFANVSHSAARVVAADSDVKSRLVERDSKEY